MKSKTKIEPEDLVEKFRAQERERLDKIKEEADKKKQIEQEQKDVLKSHLDDLLAPFENTFRILEKYIHPRIHKDTSRDWWTGFDHTIILMVSTYFNEGNVLFKVNPGYVGQWNRWDLSSAREKTDLNQSEAAIVIAEFLGKTRAFYNL